MNSSLYINYNYCDNTTMIIMAQFYDTRNLLKFLRVLWKDTNERIREEGAKKGNGVRERNVMQAKIISTLQMFSMKCPKAHISNHCSPINSFETGAKVVQHVEILDWCISQCITYYFSFPLYLAGCHNNLLFVQIDSLHACIGYKTGNKGKTTQNFNFVKVTRANLFLTKVYKIHTTIFPLNNLGIVPSTHVPFILFSTLSSSWKKNQFLHKIYLQFLNLFITHTTT